MLSESVFFPSRIDVEVHRIYTLLVVTYSVTGSVHLIWTEEETDCWCGENEKDQKQGCSVSGLRSK